MSEQELRKAQVNILDQYFEGIFNNEVDTIPLADTISFQGPLVSKVLTGKEEVLSFLTDVAASFSNAQYHTVRDIIDGEHIFSLVKIRLSEGQILDMGHVFEIRDGVIHSIQVLFDPSLLK
jgi:hypothetical protein